MICPAPVEANCVIDIAAFADERAAIITLARAEPYPDPAPGQAPEPSLRAPQWPISNQPTPLTRLIGRKQDLAAVRNALMRSETRLLTLVGAPGIGKTRLSIAVAHDVQAAFTDGAFFVALAPIGDPALVLATIAQALGIKETVGQPPLDQLKAALRVKRALLLLDNFEQVLDAVPLVAELLEACPGLKALVTSQAALHVRGERPYAVPPLLLPDLRHLPATVTIARNPAVALFMERAQAVMPDFALTEQNAPAVAAICVRLDGLPLAIELAAARIKMFSPAALLQRLHGRLDLLVHGPCDLPVRQRSLRDAIAWSYDLLNAGEQILFRRLGVFVGGWTLEAAEAVCGADDLHTGVFDSIESLLDKRLIHYEVEPRFGMLESIREYALEQLAGRGEIEGFRQRHTEYFTALTEAAEPQLKGVGQQTWLERLEQEHDNLRAALTWSLGTENRELLNDEQWTTDHGPRPEIGLRLVAALARFWELRGYREEWRAWVQRAAAWLGAVEPSVARAKVLLQAGIMVHDEQGEHVQGISLVEESLTLARGLGDQSTGSGALCELGRIMYFQGEHAQGITLVEEGLVLARTAGDAWSSATTLCRLGDMASAEGDHARARVLLADSLALSEQVGDIWGRGRALRLLAGVAIMDGDFRQATALLEQGLALNRTLGSIRRERLDTQ